MLQQRIEAGLAWLDTHYPHWKQDLLLETLNLGSCTYCILGQLEGYYFDAMERWRLTPEQMIELGFNIEIVGDYGVLTNAWRDVLAPVL